MSVQTNDPPFVLKVAFWSYMALIGIGFCLLPIAAAAVVLMIAVALLC